MRRFEFSVPRSEDEKFVEVIGRLIPYVEHGKKSVNLPLPPVASGEVLSEQRPMQRGLMSRSRFTDRIGFCSRADDSISGIRGVPTTHWKEGKALLGLASGGPSHPQFVPV